MHFNVKSDIPHNTPLSGLAFVEYIAAASSLLNASKGKGGGGGGGGEAGPAFITTTNVNTQVSPQISPIFTQQSNPSNSPVNAGATMGVPVTGAIPGFDNLMSLPQPMKAAVNPLAVAGVGAALLALIYFTKKRKTSK